MLTKTSDLSFISVNSFWDSCTLYLRRSSSSRSVEFLYSFSRSCSDLILSSREKLSILSVWLTILLFYSVQVVLNFVISSILSARVASRSLLLFFSFERSSCVLLNLVMTSLWVECIRFSFDSNFNLSYTSSSWFLLFCNCSSSIFILAYLSVFLSFSICSLYFYISSKACFKLFSLAACSAILSWNFFSSLAILFSWSFSISEISIR